MLTYILLAVAVAVVVLVIVIAMRPGEFRVSRSITLAAPPSIVFEQVNDLHNWNAWSPWARMDPNAKNSFEGPSAGVGAIMRWEGPKTGQGGMTIVESRPSDLIGIKLEFLKPFKATNAVKFTFEPTGDSTVVTWSMIGTNNFMAKAFGLVVNCEKMCGDQFNQGLSNLREVTEGQLAANR